MRGTLESIRREIADVRSRLRDPDWTRAKADTDIRLRVLESLIGSAIGDEVHRHVVVGSVAALQTFHRSVIVEVVGLGDMFRARAAERFTEKFSMKDALAWIGREPITFAELVAHTTSANSVGDLVSTLEILLSIDLKASLRKAVDPLDARNGMITAPLVANVDTMLSDLAEAFRLRHIFAHEAAPTTVISESKCRALWSSIELWVRAIDAVLWATVYKDYPLTQSEMNEHSSREVVLARIDLARAMRRALGHARRRGHPVARWLRRNHFDWMKTTKDWVLRGPNAPRGTMWPAVIGADFASEIRSRTQQVESWSDLQEL